MPTHIHTLTRYDGARDAYVCVCGERTPVYLLADHHRHGQRSDHMTIHRPLTADEQANKEFWDQASAKARATGATDMEPVKIVNVPHDEKPLYALDGIHLIAIDTDPDENLALSLANCRAYQMDVLVVIPTTFRGQPGYLLVTRDAAKPNAAHAD